MKSLILGLAAAASLAAALPAAAQTVDAAREHRQSERVHQGVRSGELTPKEALIIHRQEAGLHRYEARVRHHHHGYLTPQARRHLTSMERRNSRLIYRAKHNNQVRR